MVMRMRFGSVVMETVHSTLDGNLVDLIPFGKLIPIFSPKVCVKSWLLLQGLFQAVVAVVVQQSFEVDKMYSLYSLGQAIIYTKVVCYRSLNQI